MKRKWLTNPNIKGPFLEICIFREQIENLSFFYCEICCLDKVSSNAYLFFLFWCKRYDVYHELKISLGYELLQSLFCNWNNNTTGVIEKEIKPTETDP